MINVSVDNDFVYFFEDEIKLYFLRFNIAEWYINEFTIIDFTIYTRLFSWILHSKYREGQINLTQ